MKFRTISRINYLKKARHRRGHGIHSPFLFYLITEVIENKEKLPQFKSLKPLKKKVLDLIDISADSSVKSIYEQFDIRYTKPKKLYKKVELSVKYVQIIFQLILEFKPSSIIHYGPTLGVDLAILAAANIDSRVYQVNNDPFCELISKRLLNDSAIGNIQFVPENSVPEIIPEFVLLNCFSDPDLSQSIIQNYINQHSDDGVLIIRGIHESKEMEAIWKEAIASQSIRVSLDLFAIGIILFRKGLQKENFILKV
jgi:hypothetical protein